jgi:glycolate oxidase FAD binding subunit
MRAASEADVVEIVREARARRTTLEIAGGGTRRNVGRPVQCDAVLEVGLLSGIVSYEPEELILTVGPGTPLAEIEQVLAAKGQRLGFEPQDWSALLGSSGTATIAGAISCNADGPAAMRYGRARDHLLGIRAVNGFGEAFKAGGKVVKNVTGFDIPKLVCGAFGTLCVLTELTFRVFPRPERSAIFAARLPPREGFALLRKVWSSPLDATALSYADGMAFVRLEGALEEKCAMLQDFGDLEDAETLPGPALFAGHDCDIWRLRAQPSDAADIVSAAPGPWYGDHAGAQLWIGGSTPRSGILIRGRERPTPFPPEEPARAALTRAVKAAFDPLGIFNPGRMYEGV